MNSIVIHLWVPKFKTFNFEIFSLKMESFAENVIFNKLR
jgi:hypothetical protein